MATRWPINVQRLDELDLDIRNVRIPGGAADEGAIAKYLVEAEDLMGLVQDILRDGYLDNEIPVVTEVGNRYVVLEGNRRIAALKAIANPPIVGTAAPRVERLISRYGVEGAATEVRVMNAPSREAAQPLLARLHTRNPKRAWLREQQAIFYHAQLSPSVGVDDLREQYPGETSSIASFIRMGEMRELIRALRYDDPSLEEFVKSSKLKMTSFEYAYDSSRIQKALGLEFDRDGRLASKVLTDGQKRALLYLLKRFKEGKLNTRSPELKARSDEHGPFVEHLQRLVSGTEVESSVSGETNGGTGGASGTDALATSTPAGGILDEAAPGGSGESQRPDGNGQAAGAPGLRGPNRGDTKTRLDMSGFAYRGSSPGLRRRFEELRKLDVRTYPNAAYDLLRTVLECSIKDYFNAQSRPLTPGKTLQGCIEELARAYRRDRRMTSFINSINRRGKLPAQQYTGTAASLNASNHEPDDFATGLVVHEAWERIKPILVEIVG